jgi:hypothetical protein
MNEMVRLVLLMVLLVACAPEIDMSKVVAAPPGARDAERIITERYGCGLAELYFYGPASMDCYDGKGFTSPVSGKCVRATSWNDTIIVGIQFDGQKVSDMQLVHEYKHFALDPDRDGGHTRPEIWGFTGVVEDARREINALGL